MNRIIFIVLAIAISNVAAWFLLAASSPFISLAIDPAGTSFKSALFLMFIMICYGPIYILLGFLPLSIIVAISGLALRRYAQRDCIVGGALAGLGLYVSLVFLIGPRDASVFISGPPIGAICGWIYWLIAIRGRASTHEVA